MVCKKLPLYADGKKYRDSRDFKDPLFNYSVDIPLMLVFYVEDFLFKSFIWRRMALSLFVGEVPVYVLRFLQLDTSGISP